MESEMGEINLKILMNTVQLLIDDYKCLFPIKANISFQYLSSCSNKLKRYFDINVNIIYYILIRCIKIKDISS